MLLLLSSVFGIIVIDRFYFRLLKVGFISPKKRLKLFVLSILPLHLVYIFKDLQWFVWIYIGIFFSTFTLFFIFFEKIMKSIYENTKLHVIDALILQIRSGQSPQKALKETFDSLGKYQKLIFECLTYIKTVDPRCEQNIRFQFSKDYIFDVQRILQSSTRVLEHLLNHRKNLKIEQTLLYKTRQVTYQIRAQAVVASVLYVLMTTLSWRQLGLSELPWVVVASASMFSTGVILVFKMGKNIKWQI